MEEIKKYLVPIAVVAAGIIIAGGLIYTQQTKKEGSGEGNILSSQEAAQKAIDYINENFTQGAAEISLISAAEEFGLYKIRLKVQDQEFDSYVTKNGKLLFLQAIELEESLNPEAQTTIGDFSVEEGEICKDSDKPIVYFFGTETCPYCQWEHPIVESVAKRFEGQISFHNNMDSDADKDVFEKYSDGGVPTIVIGCKYYRVGSGEDLGEEEEAKILTALTCKLTDKKPADVCSGVQDLIDQAQ